MGLLHFTQLALLPAFHLASEGSDLCMKKSVGWWWHRELGKIKAFTTSVSLKCLFNSAIVMPVGGNTSLCNWKAQQSQLISAGALLGNWPFELGRIPPDKQVMEFLSGLSFYCSMFRVVSLSSRSVFPLVLIGMWVMSYSHFKDAVFRLGRNSHAMDSHEKRKEAMTI